MLSDIFLVSGTILIILSMLSVYKFDDFFSKIHPAGVIDSLGSTIIFIGLMLKVGISIIALKLLLLIIFLMVTNPTATHLLAKIYYNNNKKEIYQKYKFDQDKL